MILHDILGGSAPTTKCVICRCLERHSLHIKHQQNCGRGFIRLQLQAAVLPGSDAVNNCV